MRLKPRQLLLTAIVMAGGVAGTMPLAWAQGQPQTSETLKSDSTGPQDPRSTGSVGRSTAPLSDKLDRTDGVAESNLDGSRETAGDSRAVLQRLNQMRAGFTSEAIETADTRIFVCRAGSGPPLLLRHGFPRPI